MQWIFWGSDIIGWAGSNLVFIVWNHQLSAANYTSHKILRTYINFSLKLHSQDSRNKSFENCICEKQRKRSEQLGILFYLRNAIIKPSSDLTTPHKKSERKNGNSRQNVRIIFLILNFARHLKELHPQDCRPCWEICQKRFAVTPLKIVGPKNNKRGTKLNLCPKILETFLFDLLSCEILTPT